MQRLRLYDARVSRLPTVIGACTGDIGTIARYLNSAQRRLISCPESGDEGWWGAWAEVIFNVSITQPYITLPREIARLELVNVCNQPVSVQNQFYEYLQFGNGRLPKTCRQSCGRNPLQVYSRNNAVTFTDLINGPKLVRAYLTSDQDIGKRVMIQGLDSSDTPVYSTDGLNRVSGIFLNLDAPFVTTTFGFKRLTGIQKDITSGQVQIFSVDPADGTETLLLTMEPSEQTAWYRRYYFDKLPVNCCGDAPGSTTVSVTAIAKLELVPVMVDTDYLYIQELEALTEECMGIRYSEADAPEAKSMADRCHKRAVGYLIGQNSHYAGRDTPAINVSPFGSARLEKQAIGVMM